MRKAKVYMHNKYAGLLSETDKGYEFTYDKRYLKLKKSEAISLTLPLSDKPYKSKTLFAFFDGLSPEGWLENLALKNYNLKYGDRMGLLLSCCRNCIGAVGIEEVI